MTREVAINKVCDIVAVAYHSMADYRTASDCFCGGAAAGLDGHFQNDGETIAYVRKAVFEKLRRDGFDVKE